MLDSTVLSADILARWRADPACGLSSPLTAAQEAMLKAQTDAIAAAVVAHLQAAAVVSGFVTVKSVSGVTTGPGISGPGVGSLSAGRIS
jgi:hypothetical protein